MEVGVIQNGSLVMGEGVHGCAQFDAESSGRQRLFDALEHGRRLLIDPIEDFGVRQRPGGAPKPPDLVDRAAMHDGHEQRLDPAAIGPELACSFPQLGKGFLYCIFSCRRISHHPIREGKRTLFLTPEQLD